jgi:hypothetical protein
LPYAPNSVPLELFYAAIDSGLLLGLLAAYLGTAERTGHLGFGAFLIALLGIASILGPSSLGYYLIGASIFVGGLALFALALLRAHVLRLPAVLWLASAAAGTVVTATANAALFSVSGVLLGLGYVALCVAIARGDLERA